MIAAAWLIRNTVVSTERMSKPPCVSCLTRWHRSKSTPFRFQGIPKLIYTDNGPVAKSQVFQQVMRCLDIDVRAHLPQGKDGRRATARSTGKVERPFRTVKEMHETLYHFHEPQDEEVANAWLL